MRKQRLQMRGNRLQIRGKGLKMRKKAKSCGKRPTDAENPALRYELTKQGGEKQGSAKLDW